MRVYITTLLTITSVFVQAQQALYIKVMTEGKAPVAASLFLKDFPTRHFADSSGGTSVSFPANGTYILVTTAAGFEETETEIIIPHGSDTLEIELKKRENELEEVVVQSTRTSRIIANVPTRVETIAWEEIDEKTNMRPSNVAMLLHESTGIQVQQTSATSGSASIRIQGLDGRYTQLLKDGFANFGNFSSGLSVLEIPPLDLQQVEIIKGPASTLFGGGAIAGVVNFVSKIPRSKPEYRLILNHSNIGQTNIGGFASGRRNKLGYTMLALYNRSNAYDVDEDDFTEVPKSDEFTIHPKLFFYPNETTTLSIGNSLTAGNRTGGDIQVIHSQADAAHQYTEKNKTFRNISTFELAKQIGDRKRLIAKQSFSVFDRTIRVPAYTFSGINYNSFTDIAYVTNGSRHALVLGGNLVIDQFNEKDAGTRNNSVRTGGLYAQHTWDVTDRVKLETGLRADITTYKNAVYTNRETFILPRLSLLVNYSSDWTSRISAGMGYKSPTLFTEETETIQYRNVQQLQNVVSEKSYGGTADINFRTTIGDHFAISFNHMFFYTWIEKPLVLEEDIPGSFRFKNAGRPVQSSGFETNAKLIFHDNVKLFLGYTFTHTKANYLPGGPFLPLVPRTKLNTALIYEKEDMIKIGLEGYFTGRQYLKNATRTPSFSEFGFMTEKIFRRFSLYLNLENFTDTRQGKFKKVANGAHLNPTFDEIWTHTEGFVVNGGIKIKL
jgi:iron complex outermembrane receptor protein/outer membrane receptor for ferrienterochelin and colicins